MKHQYIHNDEKLHLEHERRPVFPLFLFVEKANCKQKLK